ncbi:MAG: TlpA family protein disulfide reductase [Ardenticatenia bacterium]|nr:MAG: TlpA family protein disulfide reductase [Ardenticatenia bacterium]
MSNGNAMKNKRNLWLLGGCGAALAALFCFLCFCALVLFFWSVRPPSFWEQQRRQAASPQSEETWPVGLTDASGRTWTEADFKGRTLVLNFWASWCGPCRQELPELQTMARTYADQGVIVLLINTDEPPQVVERFLREEGLTLPYTIDTDGRWQQRYHVRALPTTLVFAPDGDMTARITGWRGTAYLRRAIETALPETR